MASIINALSTGSGGVVTTADASGILQLQSNGTTAATVNGSIFSLATALATSSGGTGLSSYTANGVVYASSTSVLTTGSALTFDGSKLVAAGSNEAIRVASAAPYINFYNAAQTTQYGYIQHTGTDFAVVNVQNGAIPFYTNNTERARIDSSGNLLVGQTSSGAVNSNSWSFTQSAAGQLVGNHASGSASGSYYIGFYYNTTGIGSITQAGTTGVLYNVTSDQRLKTDLGTVTSTDVIANTVIHDFTWKSDGSQARGVFAQEAAKVLPAAVKVGDDGEEVTDQWQVDYSKYVPDIIVELQSLLARVAQLESQLKG